MVYLQMPAAFFSGNSVCLLTLLGLSGKLQAWLLDFLLLLFCSKGQKLKNKDYNHIQPHLHRTLKNLSVDCLWPIRKFLPIYLLRRKFRRDGVSAFYLLCSVLKMQPPSSSAMSNIHHLPLAKHLE